MRGNLAIAAALAVATIGHVSVAQPTPVSSEGQTVSASATRETPAKSTAVVVEAATPARRAAMPRPRVRYRKSGEHHPRRFKAKARLQAGRKTLPRKR